MCCTLSRSQHKNILLWFMMQETLFDEFVIAHTLGWWGKAIMVRNLPLLWVLSIGFELMEVGQPPWCCILSLPPLVLLLDMGTLNPVVTKVAMPGLLCITLSLLLSHQLVHMYVKHLRSFSMKEKLCFFTCWRHWPCMKILSFESSAGGLIVCR